ncbi:biotin/lipoyl-containing protein [Micromonospora sp. NPDC047548]|uniref:biotin/lipoyl-containing protein n=1 Tax=Micromonospora sp. NPDC047548 TaxID=3155624 RepID=UPI00340985A8
MPEGGARVDAPFVANVWKVEVAVGDVVEEGQTLVALEAMKMETYVAAPSAGVVTAVPASPGAQVAPGDALVVLGRAS